MAETPGLDPMLPDHAHLWPNTAQVDSMGHLRIGGVRALDLVKTYGSPLYVYDEATIRAQCRAFRQALAACWSNSAVAYAGKAYLSPALCRVLLDEGMELDTVSWGEVAIACAGGFSPGRIHLHGNFKPEAELIAAIEAGVGRIVVDSLDELERLELLAGERGRRVGVWLRLCPDVATATHAHVQTGHAGSKFGLDLASGAVYEAARHAVASPWLDLLGLHAHAGSQLFTVQPEVQVIGFLAGVAADLRDQLGATIHELSPGGGLGVAYTPGEISLDVGRYVREVTSALAADCDRLRLPRPRLVIEPGRAIVARAGVALYTAGPRKASPDGAILLAVDGGMGDNPRPALYGAQYHAALAERMREHRSERVRIVGRYCESGDELIHEVWMPPVRQGDVVAIPVSGAYHLPLSSSYNGVPQPAVAFVGGGKSRLVRRRETTDDLLRLDVSE